MFDLRVPRAQCNWQRTAHRSHSAIKRKLADSDNVRQVLSFAEVTVRSQNAERNWQIETCAFLAYICRRQIDCRLVKRKEECAVVDGCTNAFAGFSDGEIRKTNNDDRRRLIG